MTGKAPRSSWGPPHQFETRDDPLGVALNAGLDLARMERSGAHLDDEEKAVLDVCDEIGHVRAIAASDVDECGAGEGEVVSELHPDARTPEL